MSKSDFELMEHFSVTGKYRNSLYMEPSKVEGFYVQKVAQVVEFTKSTGSGRKVSGNILNFLGAEVAGEKGLEGRVAISPMLQAIVAENAARESGTLVDLALSKPAPGELLYYVGEAHITVMGQDPVAKTIGVPLDSCSRITDRRKTQETILRWKNEEIGSILLTFVAQGKVYASIASTEFIKLNSLSSYHREKHFGILCTMEGQAESEVTFLDPLWIWYESP